MCDKHFKWHNERSSLVRDKTENLLAEFRKNINMNTYF